MSLPVPSAYSAQLLLTLWLGFLLVVVLGYGLVRWWQTRGRKPQPIRPIYNRTKAKKRGGKGRRRDVR